MDWDKLRIFHAVASAGSFTHAGQMLTLSQSAVSRQISALEEEISTPLFQRHARGLTLTDEGELLYGAVSDVLARLAAAEEALKNIHDSPRGSLKITASHGIGAYWLLPRMQEFLKEFPEVEVHLVMDDRELDLSQRAADLAIRMRAPVQADLIQRKLFTVHHHVYASVDYLKKHGIPKSAEDLDKHKILIFGTSATYLNNLTMLQTAGRPEGEPRPVALRVNSAYGLRRAAQAGAGIAILADYLVAPDMNLVQIDLPIDTPEYDTYFVYPEELKETKRVTAFRDFLVSKAKEWSF